MSKFSVKKPYTIFVAVVAIIVLGIVSYTKMTPDLMPNMNLPYVLVITTYPGATPEKVELEVSRPLEQSFATLDKIKNVVSTSSENYSMIALEFEADVNILNKDRDVIECLTTANGLSNNRITDITGAGDFYKSQVTQGGISLNDIDLDTLESNIIKDLYLIGEVLDVDGKCGGYNLGFAWMSAIKVSDNIC